MLEFINEDVTYLGVFLVRKKSGQLRIIFDTRVANTFFKQPPHTSLPTAAAIAGVEARHGEELYFSAGDIESAFYSILAPPWARKYFTLPRVKAFHVGPPGNHYVTPRLLVLPMGWSWSLWF